MPKQEEGEGEIDIRVRGGLRGGLASSQDLLNDFYDDEASLDGETEEEYARRTRDLEVHLPADSECFAKLRFWQKPRHSSSGDLVYSLYFEHSNGKTLADLRDAYRAARRRVPEHFIWHVCEQLCEAMARLHYPDHAGPADTDSDDDYHRASDSSSSSNNEEA